MIQLCLQESRRRHIKKVTLCCEDVKELGQCGSKNYPNYRPKRKRTPKKNIKKTSQRKIPSILILLLFRINLIWFFTVYFTNQSGLCAAKQEQDQKTSSVQIFTNFGFCFNYLECFWSKFFCADIFCGFLMIFRVYMNFCGIFGLSGIVFEFWN